MYVTVLSTIHKDEMILVQKGTSVIEKPKYVVDCNKNMGLIDHADMFISFNETTRKTVKWY